MRKLVRHKIPDLMAVDAGRFQEPTRTERTRLLRRKLQEEVVEYLESGEPDELADIFECVFALAGDAGLTTEQFLMICSRKTAKRGHLQAPGVVWVVDEP